MLRERESRGPLRPLKRILIIRNGALGDFILTLPVIDSLRKAFPRARLAVMGNPAIVRIAEDRIDTIIPHDLPGLHRLYQEQCPFPEHIRERLGSFDLVVSYSPDPEGIFIRNLKRIGNPWIIDGSLPSRISSVAPVTDLLQLPLQQEGIPVSSDPPGITPSAADRVFARDFLEMRALRGKNLTALVALHPGSGSSRKCWSADSFGQMARWVNDFLNATVLLISGPADRQVTRAVLPLIKDTNPILIEHFSVTRVAALLEHCSLFLGNDSGITHLAAAIGIPTIALFGPTDPRLWAPKNTNVRVIKSSYPCAPCSPQQMSRCAHPGCMHGMSPALVKNVIYETLNGVFFPCSAHYIAYHCGRQSYHVQG